jgi:cell shape-determining protein MreD
MLSLMMWKGIQKNNRPNLFCCFVLGVIYATLQLSLKNEFENNFGYPT